MRAFVRFRLSDGSTVEIGHGDLIGRLWSAALSLPDGRISEAHAIVSLRGQELKLLALRGRFATDGVRHCALVLRPGQRIAFAKGLELLVEDIELPALVVASAAWPKLRPRPLPARRGAPIIQTDGSGWLTGADFLRGAQESQLTSRHTPGCSARLRCLPRASA